MKGSRDLICEPFFTFVEDRWAMKPGQLYWAQAVYPHHYPLILQMVNYDPLDERKTEFRIKSYSSGDESHYPVKELGLREGELYHVYIGKQRLVVILGYIESEWLVGEKPQKILMCAPMFSFKSQHTQEMVIKTQAFAYPNLFYLPPDVNGCPEESAIRFELIQPIMKGFMQPFTIGSLSKGIPLSEEAYWLMINHLVKYICNKKIDDEIDELAEVYQGILLEEFEKDKIN